MSDKKAIGLFEAYGIELEYMIVAQDTMNVLPVTDKVLYDIAGAYTNEVEMGDMGWSNELALHVLEFKTDSLPASLKGLDKKFHDQVLKANELLARLNGKLMPGSMHPWMDPHTEMQLWPHENSPIYDAYDRIFNSKGHGWANLQSMHINLPFANDEEFGRLHAAIRLILPLLPGIAASSPVADSEIKEYKDYRLNVYRKNQAKIPSIAGQIIPEAVYTEQDYREKILRRMYNDIAPFDPEGILQDEWLNSRGAIARFDRNAIEIRLIDLQEYPTADLAIASLVTNVLKALCAGKWSTLKQQQLMHESSLSQILSEHIRSAEYTTIEDTEYLGLFGFPGKACTSAELWQHLFEEVKDQLEEDYTPAIKTILTQGTLSTRIVKALGDNLTHEHIRNVYNRLSDCLMANKPFQYNE